MSAPPPHDKPPRRDSGTLGVFADTCDEILLRLAAVLAAFAVDDEVREIEAEARDLATAFSYWRAHPPTPADREAAIRRVMSLHKRAQDYLESHARRLR